jgi:hypothetical protein
MKALGGANAEAEASRKAKMVINLCMVGCVCFWKGNGVTVCDGCNERFYDGVDDDTIPDLFLVVGVNAEVPPR